MRHVSRLFSTALVVMANLLTSPSVFSQPAVWTYHNDNSRTGANTNETILTPSTVNTNSFGKLFIYPVDGYIYTQPLYVPNVTITNKGVHNIVFVGTEGDTVYAFDADSNAGGNATPLWSRNLLGVSETTLNTNDLTVGTSSTADIVPQIGITGTPVIDVTNGTLYVVSKSKLVSGGKTNFYQRLHALDITSGNERPNSPADIAAVVSGSGEGSSNGMVTFSAIRQHQRSSLLLMNGVVYIVWASHGDISPYHGWIMGYDAQTLAQISVFNVSPNGVKTGIWQGGNGAAADTNGNLFFMTGNGTFDAPTNNDYGDSFVRLSTANAHTNLVLGDYFTPYNQDQLGGPGHDTDLGSGGALLLPDSIGSATHRHLVIGAGKGGTIYLVDRDNMGHFNLGNDSQIVQSIPGGLTIPNMSTPSYLNNRVFYISYKDVIKAFSISNAALSTTPINQSSSAPSTYFGPTTCLSANGTSNAILWFVSFDQYKTSGPAVLFAYNAYDLTSQLYTSSQASGGRDTGPAAVKFSVPTVVNGKVYVPGQATLAVYGYGAFTAAPIIVAQPQTQTVQAGTDLTLSVGALSSNAFTVTWFFDGAKIPGATTTNLLLGNVQPSNAGFYTVTLSNSFGVTTSAKAYLSVVAPLTNNPGAVLAPSGLVNWWPGDGNGVDIVGGKNATPINNMTYTDGESGQAFQFDGTNSYLNVGTANLTPPWTVCMWVKRQSSSSNSTILLGDTSFYLKLEQYNNTFDTGFTQLSVKDNAFSYSTPSNTWTHLAFVATATSLSVYGNGVLQGTIATNNFPLPRSYIGTGFANTRFIDFVHCALDDIMVFNRALSAGELSNIAGAGSAGVVRAPQFSSFVQTNGQFQLALKGLTGKTFTVYSSPDLINWTPATTLANPAGTNIFNEAVTNSGAKFYKLSQP